MKTTGSYQQKEKRKSRRLEITALLVIFAGALGMRWWSDAHRPPVHPLPLTITEEGIARQQLHTISMRGSVLGKLDVKDNMKKLAQNRPIEGGLTKWELVEVASRLSPDQAWIAKPQPANAKPLPILIGESSSLPYYQFHSLADHDGEWKFIVRASREYYDADTKEEWNGAVSYTLIRPYKEDKKANAIARKLAKENAWREARGLPLATPTPFPPPPGARVLDKSKAYVARIQWSPQGGPWRDIPKQGQKGFPLKIAADEVTGFRGTKKNPKEPWPDWSADMWDGPGKILIWDGHITPKGGLNGEEVWIMPSEQHAISADATDLKTVSLSCGNKVTCQIQVTPPTN